jgi:hypothetical protein
MLHPPDAYRVSAADARQRLGTPEALDFLATVVCERVCRTDLARPGFAFLDAGTAFEPRTFRAFLADFAAALDGAYRRAFGRRLLPLSVSRFDQQVSTGAHRDGGPDESVLLLGYEPTEVDSSVQLLDHTRCAAERGLTPAEFLTRYNPAFGPGLPELRGYTTTVEGFDAGRYRFLVVNNGNFPLSERERGMLGVLHKAVITTARPGRPRVINSLLLATADPGETGFSGGEIETFVASGAPASR